MLPDGDSPHLPGRQDAAALIGVLAVLEGHLVAGDLGPQVAAHLGERLGGPGAGAAELRVALGDLGHRLAHALGEYDEAPVPDAGQVDVHAGFASRPTPGHSSTTLPLSAAFDAERARLLALASEHGGRDGGWGSLPPDLRP